VETRKFYASASLDWLET